MGSGFGLRYHFIPFYTTVLYLLLISSTIYDFSTQFLENTHAMLLDFFSGESSCGYLVYSLGPSWAHGGGGNEAKEGHTLWNRLGWL